MAASPSSADTNDDDDLASSPPLLQRLTQQGVAANVSINLVPPINSTSSSRCEGPIAAGRELSTGVEGRQAQSLSSDLGAPDDEREASPFCTETEACGIVTEEHGGAEHTGQGEAAASSLPCDLQEGNSGEVTLLGRPWRSTATMGDLDNSISSRERLQCRRSTEQRPGDARRDIVGVAAEEHSFHGRVEGFHLRVQDRSYSPAFKKNERKTPWCRIPNPKFDMPPEEAPGTSRHGWAAERDVEGTVLEETLVHRHEARREENKSSKSHGASLQCLARARTAPGVARDDNGDNEFIDPGRPGVMMGSRRVAWPPCPPPSSSTSGTAASSRHQHKPTLQERRAKSFSVNHRSASFVERQELEQLIKEHRREEMAEAEEEARRKLASGGCRMNRTSRAILARSSSSPFCIGGGGRSSAARDGTGGQGPSVFERLARCASEPFTEGAYGCDGSSDEEWTRETWVGANSGACCSRQPFTPMINARSSRLALRMPRREGDGESQQRLFRDGEEQLRRRERRIQLAEQALQRRVNSCHVNPVSERVLERRSRSKILKFKSKMRKMLEVVDSKGTGWLSFAGLESVLGECEMLPAQPSQEEYDDVLLAVWTALSEDSLPGGGGGSGGGGHDGCEGPIRSDECEREGACGVPIDGLAALLTGVASESYGCGWTDSLDQNDPPYPRDRVQKAERKSLPLRPANPRLWGGDGEERVTRALEPGEGFAAMLHRNEQLEDLCDQLRDVFDTNRRERAYDTSNVQAVTASGVAGEGTGASPVVASPAQVAATAARFEEQIRAKQRKIELLRRAEETRKQLSHPFEPSMATTATPKAARARRKAAANLESKKDGIPSAERGDGSSRTINEALQAKKADLRTTEEREVEEKCTFQPRLFQPLPISPPRYPVPKTTHSSTGVGGESESSILDSAEGSPPRTAVDRATASWYAQVNRLKAGRKDRLRRLEQKQAIENRCEPLPPSVQQLFHDAGMEIYQHERHGRGDQRRTSVGAKQNGANDRIAQNKTVSNTQSPLSRGMFASPPRLRLEARLRARNRLKEKRSQDQARKSAEEDALRQKRKRVLTRACKRSAALVGLETALSAREVERGLPSWRDPPALVAEVEFVHQKRWVFLPLWADTCPGEAVRDLARKQQGAVVGEVVNELEMSLTDELRRALERTWMGEGVRRGQGVEDTPRVGGKTRRDGDNRRPVPTVVIQVDTMDTPLPETEAR